VRKPDETSLLFVAIVGDFCDGSSHHAQDLGRQLMSKRQSDRLIALAFAKRAAYACIFGAAMVHSVGTSAAFKDAHDLPPPGWAGPVFKLSQGYPTSLPSAGARPWLQFDFKNPAQAKQYLNAVLNYCLEGNTANNFADVSTNTVRKWYHAPWLDVGPKGREFIHGMTKERRSKVGELGAAQTAEHDNWAVGFYNPRGGYVIGRVWKDPAHPNLNKANFPLHTVSCKLLFSTAPLSEVPFLDGSLEWEGDINRASGTGTRPKLHLLQLDVAIRDSRAGSTTGWVFGTFQYERAAPGSVNWWEHMVPVGLMWGNDAPRVLLNQPPKEQWINVSRGQQLHLGLRGLLNGPIDNPNASCVACHGLAQVKLVDNPTPTLPAIPTDSASSATLQTYLRNVGHAEDYSADYASVDYSLQLQAGIANAINEGQASINGVPTPTRRAVTARFLNTPVTPISRGDD
jgi:hypothetical protein